MTNLNKISYTKKLIRFTKIDKFPLHRMKDVKPMLTIRLEMEINVVDLSMLIYSFQKSF